MHVTNSKIDIASSLFRVSSLPVAASRDAQVKYMKCQNKGPSKSRAESCFSGFLPKSNSQNAITVSTSAPGTARRFFTLVLGVSWALLFLALYGTTMAR
jgi:hypothetical protein